MNQVKEEYPHLLEKPKEEEQKLMNKTIPILAL
jgi:hypothetical protein